MRGSFGWHFTRSYYYHHHHSKSFLVPLSINIMVVVTDYVWYCTAVPTGLWIVICVRFVRCL